MPAFSRTETLLVKRYDDDPGNIYPKGVVKKESINVAFPFLCVKLSISNRLSFEDNIFIRTVSALYDIKEKEGYNNEQIIDYLAEKTALDRIVIKTILKKKKLNTDVVTNTLNTQENLKTVFLFYDPISKQFLPSCIEKSDFEYFSSVAERSVEPNTRRHDLYFSLQLQSHRERALLLGFDGADSGWAKYEELTSPAQVPVKILEDVKYSLGIQHDVGNIVVNDVGEWQSVWLICNCSINSDDLSSIAINSPLSTRYSRQLYETIRKTVSNNPVANQELAGELERLDKIRLQRLENAATFIDEQQDAQIWILQRYPDLKQYESVLKKVATFIARFPKDNVDDRTGSMIIAGRWSDEERLDITRDFHSAMEYVFSAAVKKCFPNEYSEKIIQACEILRKPRPRGFASYFIPMAQEIGFPQNASEDFFTNNRVKHPHVREILIQANPDESSSSRKKMQYGLTELIVAMMIEAAVDASHPFRRIAAICPNLFEAMANSKKWRDHIKHNDEQKPEPLSVDELYRMRALLSICLELLSRKTSKEEQAKTATLLNGRRAARIKADNEMQNYSAIKTLEGTRDYVREVSFRYYFQDPEYFSECYNLLANGLFYELLNHFDCPNGEKTIDTVFTGTNEEVWPRVLKIYEKYGCDYIKELPPPQTSDLFHAQRDIMKWSLRNKVAVMFATFDADRPELLKKIVTATPDIVTLTDTVHMCRGHNNEADFSKFDEGYILYHSPSGGKQNPSEPMMKVDIDFHKRLLDRCEVLSKFILEVE